MCTFIVSVLKHADRFDTNWHIFHVRKVLLFQDIIYEFGQCVYENKLKCVSKKEKIKLGKLISFFIKMNKCIR